MLTNRRKRKTIRPVVLFYRVVEMEASKTYFGVMTWAEVVAWVLNSRGWIMRADEVEHFLASCHDLTRAELMFLRALRNF
jgi:hypothetical protein